MEMIKKVLYAGIGLAEETKSKFSEEFTTLVEKGKEVDSNTSHLVEDFIKSLEETQSDVGTKYNTSIEKLENFISTLKISNLEKETDEVK